MAWGLEGTRRRFLHVSCGEGGKKVREDVGDALSYVLMMKRENFVVLIFDECL